MSLLVIIRHNQIGRYFVNYFCCIVLLHLLENANLLKGKDFSGKDLHKLISTLLKENIHTRKCFKHL